MIVRPVANQQHCVHRFAIALAWHRGANWEIPGSSLASAPGGALGNRGALRGALRGAPEGAQGNRGCSRECS